MSLFLIVSAIGYLAQNARSGEQFKPGKLPPAEVAALTPGLTLRFFQGGTALDARRVRLAALHVPAASPPTPFVAPGPFHAKLTGYLKNPLKGDYSFKLVGSSAITLKINDKSLLMLPADKGKSIEVELAKNFNKIEILVSSSAKGDATMRLYWAGEKFDFEPVPPDVLYSRNDDADLVEKTALREGRSLFATRHCYRCHGVAEDAMPETRVPVGDHPAPRLDYPGDRFDRNWLAAWIQNPRAIIREATMPSMFSGEDAVKNSSDISAYLVSLKREELKPLGTAPKVASGEALFKRLGCNSCHRLDHADKTDELGRLSLHHVRAKYVPNAIAHFLKAPHRRFPWTRMPDFKLDDNEAGHLEAFLREQAKGEFNAKPKGDVERGHVLFVKYCFDCHTDAREGLKTLDSLLRKLAIPIKSVDKGCLAEKDHAGAPDFRFASTEQMSLRTLLKTDRKSLTRETPAEFSLRQVKALQCNSCHRRDGESTRWHAVLEDEGKEPEKLPSMTWIGEKLKPEWTKKLLLGAHDHRARPWFKARMPAFPARAEMLAVGLSHEHGFGVDEDERPEPDANLAAIGAKLIPQQGGFNCINCHGLGKTPPTQPFEAPGINLLDAALRLRYHYYQRWMLMPERVDVTMRMPVFATDGKTTQLKEVLDGDARRQFDALWHHIQTLPSK